VSRFCIITLMVMTLMGASPDARADHSMVLISNADSPIVSISPLDLRKLYLGFVVTAGDKTQVKPILYASDELLQEIFLQNVMGMSARSYDRRLLTLTLQSGRPRPQVFEDLESVLQRIDSDPQTIVFVWEEDIENLPNIKILRVLWHP
jgi:hypothetical protein